MRTKHHRNGTAAKRVTVKGKRMVMLDEASYDALLRNAELWEPDLPGRGRQQTRLEAIAVLAGPRHSPRPPTAWPVASRAGPRAGIRPETLNRIEQGRNKPSIPTIAKIDRALQEAERATA